MDNERDRRRLKEYRDELRDAEARLAEANAEVVALQKIVAGLETRPGVADETPATAAASTADVVIEPSKVQTIITISPASSRTALTDAIRAIMRDGRPRRVADIVGELDRFGLSAATRRQRQTLTNRLVEMTDRQELVRVDRGVYKLAFPDSVAGETHVPSGESEVNSGSPPTRAPPRAPGR